LPDLAKLLPLPRNLLEHGLRRYGFHGLSYTYLMQAARQLAADKAQGKVILAHLGSGSSLAAVNNGQPVDTTMSFTPASGIMTSSRSGDIDPGIISYLLRSGMSVEQFQLTVNRKSGLLGVSGLSDDMYTLLQHEASNLQAKQAIDLYCHQVRKAIGALAATMNGVDWLIFSGGIGEVSAPIRARVGAGLEHLGIKLDAAKNQAGATDISAGQVQVSVLATNENQVIAENVIQVTAGRGEHGTTAARS
jgi:acetate kinase